MTVAQTYAEKADARLRNGQLDLARLRRDRHVKLQTQLSRRKIDALLLITSGNVLYASGAHLPAVDGGRAVHQRTATLVVAGDDWPHVFTPAPELAPPELPADHVHPMLWPETEAGTADLVRRVGELIPVTATLAMDDQTFPMFTGLPRLAPGWIVKSANSMLVAARLHKTLDEVECMWRAWLINEAANAAAEEIVRPGIRLTELVGAYYRRIHELGATCNFLDPVFQAMPATIADGPWSTNGDVPFALITTDRTLAPGDVVWTDTVMGYEGYSSDVGRTWFVDPPTSTQRALFEQWREITDTVLAAMKPGVTGADLTALAIEVHGGTKPWLDHYFLGHTLGLEGGEQQRFGSDLGQEADERFVLEPGMAIVLEPTTWQDGQRGYRCEELVIVTEDGIDRVSSYPEYAVPVTAPELAQALALEEFGPEYAPLRAARKAKVLAAMEQHDVDALVLGRIGNGRYVAGHRGLWRAVLGSFAPLVVLIRSTGGIHLAASTWDDGIPAEIPHEGLTGLTWNPRDAIAGLVHAEGLADCRRIGADGMSPGIAGLLEMLAPGVELVDGERLMREVRRVKLVAELDIMRTALAIARGCLATTLEQLRPGVTEQAMQGSFLEAMASYGLTVPGYEGTFRVLDAQLPRPGASDRMVVAGDRFGISAGVMYAGYEADIVHSEDPADPETLADVISACRPGTRPSDVLAAWTGEPQPGPLVVGLGMGVEPPIIGGPGGLEMLDDERLVAGMVLGLQAWTGGALCGAMIHVTENGAVPL